MVLDVVGSNPTSRPRINRKYLNFQKITKVIHRTAALYYAMLSSDNLLMRGQVMLILPAETADYVLDGGAQMSHAPDPQSRMGILNGCFPHLLPSYQNHPCSHPFGQPITVRLG